MKRGEIYIIRQRTAVGSEIKKARPGVIVSNDVLNATSTVVEVVYLTTQPKRDLPTHVCINATGIQSTVLCEQIDSVSTTLIGECVACCNAEEMAEIDRGLQRSLGLIGDKATTAPQITVSASIVKNRCSDAVNHPSHYTDGKIEVIDYIEDKKLGYHLGNAVKYISRAGKKDPAKTVEDLQKAAWYIQREIERLKETGT
jgi:mRNA interferase MazF